MTRDRKADLADGKRLKGAAFDLFQDHRPLYLRRLRRAMLEALLQKGQATVDDIRDQVELPDSINPKLVGAVPSGLKGIIRKVGSSKTTRSVAHARDVSIWELLDRSAAEAWLREHPDVPDQIVATGPKTQQMLDLG